MKILFMYPRPATRALNDALTISAKYSFELVSMDYDKVNVEEILSTYKRIVAEQKPDGVVSFLSFLSKELHSITPYLPIVFCQREMSFDSSILLFKFIEALRSDMNVNIFDIVRLTHRRSTIDLAQLRSSFNINYTEIDPPEDVNDEEFWNELQRKKCDCLLCSPQYYAVARKHGMFPFFFDDVISFTNLKQAFVTLLDILETTTFNSKQTRLLENIIDYSFEMIFLIDSEGRIEVANESARNEFFTIEKPFVHRMSLTSVISEIPSELIDKIKLRKETVYGYRLSINSRVYVLNAISQELNGKTFYVIYLHKDSESGAIEEHSDVKEKGLVARYKFSDIIGESEIFVEAKLQAKNFANYDSNVLIMGESGCGKELFAQSIHNESVRKNNAFVAVNCGAIPDNLLESELFGYEDGAFTGALKAGKKGAFELAEGGTIFLDEIATLDFAGQSKLLRVLEEKKIRRVGGTKAIAINVRVIAATNDDLGELVREGKFRKDLYYRLNVLSLYIPPLRDRGHDSVILFKKYISVFSKRYSKHIRLEKGCDEVIQVLSWEGNGRQVRNFAEKIVIISPDILVSPEYIRRQYDLTFSTSSRSQQIKSDKTVVQNDFVKADNVVQNERERILAALKYCHGNKKQACKILGMSYTTLWRKMVANNITSDYK